MTLVAVASIAAACTGGGTSSTASSTSTAPAATVTRHPTRPPNIVFILADDLSLNLVNEQITPHIMDLERKGETFDHYFVTDSLCCPSRSTIFTGLFPHDTSVTTNLAPDGGFQKFQSEHLDARTFAVALHDAGYDTSMLGKYLNGYGDPMTPAMAPVPPGWSDWHVSNSTGYAEFNFQLNDNGTVNSYNGQGNYGVDVLNSKAQAFIRQAGSKPFAIEVATFAPHQPYTPAPRNATDFHGLDEPRDASFDSSDVAPPPWLAGRKPLTPQQVTKIDRTFRKRAQAVESIDKLVADVEATLAAEHLTDDTYIVFSSDNGYHLGQHRLRQGKKTAFDTDIHVPLVVAGPGVPRGRVVSQVVQNTDLYPMFLELGRVTPAPAVEGRSIVPLLHPSTRPDPWRTIALVEHEQTNKNPNDPDFEGGSSDPPDYDAIRISTDQLAGFHGAVEAVYVEYKDAKQGTEFYDIAADPYEIRNIASTLTTTQRRTLHDALASLHGCHSASTCWRAGRPRAATNG